MRINRIITPKAIVVITSAVLTLILVGLFTIAVQSALINRECNDPQGEYKDSLKEMAFQEEIAKRRWDTFYRYEGSLMGSDPRKETIDSRRIWGDFNDYWEWNYKSDHLSEKRISARIVVNSPKCFDSRLVSEMQEYLN